MIGKLLAAASVGFLAVPAVAILTTVGIGGLALACVATSTGGALTATAPVPAPARAWVSAANAACPDLPEPWIAAVMAQESGFRPDAYANDSNGGTWGLFQLNQGIWTATYGAPWSADRNNNGIWDVKEPEIAASVGGEYLCNRLAGVRRIRAQNPGWASSSIPILDALIIAHNAGESRLRTYPAIPAITEAFISNVHARIAAWSVAVEVGTKPEPPRTTVPAAPLIAPLRGESLPPCRQPTGSQRAEGRAAMLPPRLGSHPNSRPPSRLLE